MQEPQVSKMPGAYDDDQTLFGALVNHKTFTVKYMVGVDALQVIVNEDASMMHAPLYLTFEGGEIWLADEVGQNAQGEWLFASESNYDQRALHGSPLQPHVEGERIFIGFLSQHVIMAKRVMQAAQKYRFLSGTDGQRLAITPQVGERFLCIDTKRIYYCLTAGVWTWMNRTHHADLDGLADNDHPQYALLTDLQGWHGNVGHMIGGDNHDHTSANQGPAVERIRYATWAGIGSPVTIPDMCFVTDVDGGTLFVSFDGASWEKLSGIPSGAIAPFNTACPPGWTRYTMLDDRFPLASIAVGTTGGAAHHTHTYTDIPAHYHTVPATAMNSDSKGSHSHDLEIVNTNGGSNLVKINRMFGNTSYSTQGGGNHSHTVTIAARDTNKAGVPSAVTDVCSIAYPPYAEVIFCKKI